LTSFYLLRVQKERRTALVPSLREYATFWGSTAGGVDSEARGDHHDPVR